MSKTVDVTEVVKLMNESEKLYDKSDEIKKKARECVERARQLCPHPSTLLESSYVEGNYNDQAYTVTDTFCSVCGMKLLSETETHSWYG